MNPYYEEHGDALPAEAPAFSCCDNCQNTKQCMAMKQCARQSTQIQDQQASKDSSK